MTTGDVRAVSFRAEVPHDHSHEDNSSVAAVSTRVAVVATPPIDAAALAAVIKLKSETHKSAVNISLTPTERDAMANKFAALAAKMQAAGLFPNGERLVRVTPNLDIFVIRKTDGTLETLYADEQQDPDVQAAYQELKDVYLLKLPGNPIVRPVFRGDRKGNVNGMAPFSMRTTHNPSAQAFLTGNFPALTTQMTPKQKAAAEERINLAEIIVGKKTAAYEKLIKSVEDELKTADDQTARQLTADLDKLKAEHRKLTQLDPHALYWLATFYPENPNNPDDCEIQGRALQKAALAATNNAQYAANLGSILMPTREKYFLYCSEHGIEMRNTNAIEDVLAEVVEMVDSGHVTPLDIAGITNGYQSQFVKDKLTQIANEVHTKATASVADAEVRMREFGKLPKIAKKLTETRAEAYRDLIDTLTDKAREVRAKAYGLLGINPAAGHVDHEELIHHLGLYAMNPRCPDHVAAEMVAVKAELEGLGASQRQFDLNIERLKQRAADLETLNTPFVQDIKRELSQQAAEAKAKMREIIRNMLLDTDVDPERVQLSDDEMIHNLAAICDEFAFTPDEKAQLFRLSQELFIIMNKEQEISLRIIEKLIPYYDPSAQEQQTKVANLKRSILREGRLTPEEADKFAQQLFDPQVRQIMREIYGIEPNTDSEIFADSVIEEFHINPGSGTNQFGEPLELGNLSPYIKGEVRALEKATCEKAKAVLTDTKPAYEVIDDRNIFELPDEELTEDERTRLAASRALDPEPVSVWGNTDYEDSGLGLASVSPGGPSGLSSNDHYDRMLNTNGNEVPEWASDDEETL